MDLSLRGISHAYGATEVLSDITLTVPSGRIVCLVGPSAAASPRCCGSRRARTARRREVLQIGAPPPGCLNPLTFVFQDFALLPWRSVAGNIRLVLEDHRLAATAWRRSSAMCWPAQGSAISHAPGRGNCRAA